MFDLVLSVRRVAKKILHYGSFTENFTQSERLLFQKTRGVVPSENRFKFPFGRNN